MMASLAPLLLAAGLIVLVVGCSLLPSPRWARRGQCRIERGSYDRWPPTGDGT